MLCIMYIFYIFIQLYAAVAEKNQQAKYDFLYYLCMNTILRDFFMCAMRDLHLVESASEIYFFNFFIHRGKILTS